MKILNLLIGCIILFAVNTQSGKQGITPKFLRCELRVNPFGIDNQNPRLSWYSESEQREQVQTAYQIIVSSSLSNLEADKADLWNSGKVMSENSSNIPYEGITLTSGAQAFWKIKLWDRDGKESGWSEPASWTMGITSKEDWKAQWIKYPSTKNGFGKTGLPIFRKSFPLNKPVKRALIHVTGLGQYELFVNGTKTGDHFLDPAWSTYEKKVYYNTFDVTSTLEQGENVLGMMLGKGFYNTHGDRRIHGVDVNAPLKLILQAEIEYSDGSSETIISDESWKVTDGPITHCAILGGSDYDARKLPEGWAKKAYRDSGWLNAAQTKGPGGKLRASMSPPIKVMEVFEQVKIDEPEPGVFVYDFGQNASSIPKLRISGKSGKVVKLKPAEQRFGNSPQTNDGDGRVNQAGVGSPNYWEYTLKGGETEEWMPQFTYTGFHYMEVSGAVPQGYPNPKGLPVVESLVSCHVRSNVETVGTFSCSDPSINAIEKIIDWSVKSNMGHVLTDCPHREKLGWLEQTYLMEPAIGFKYDILSFYNKVTDDINDARDENGAIYTVAPNFANWKEVGFGYTPEWGAAGVIVPWQVYMRYGDDGILKDNYNMMRSFVDYMHETSNDLIPIAGLGDWCDYGHGHKGWYSRYTPFELSAMATFYICTDIVSKTARVIKNQDDKAKYEKLAEKIKLKFNETYFNGTDCYTNYGSPQTANSMALVSGMVPEGKEQNVLEIIIKDIKERGNQQTAGDVGFTYLVQALSGMGRHDVLNDIIKRKDLGSYGFFVERGWTSLPENWDAHQRVSMNHLMLGHIQQWLYNDLAGIRPEPGTTGYKKIILNPKLVEGLNSAKGTYKSMYGTIVSDWKINGDKFSWNFSVPVNTTARVYIPAASKRAITESGVRATKAAGMKFVRMTTEGALFEVGSGDYHIEATACKDHVIKSQIIPVTKITPLNTNVECNSKVSIESPNEGAKIYYTLDGTEPDENLTPYTGPFQVEESCVVKARSYVEGEKPGYLASSKLNVYKSETNHFNYEYYHGNWKLLPDFDALTPVKIGKITVPDIEKIASREHNFAIRFKGLLDITQFGEYTFFLKVDDGGKLYLDGKLLVNNDGLHGSVEKHGKIKLEPGKHSIIIEYMQAGAGKEFELRWEGPGFGKELIDLSRIYPDIK
ncbi:family 78 glycoside hydrolase catalytic domain [Mariniphaga anaerophila]|nr:family 78 glycoside hydrolase catalytic domain [Mariniphaga anaerophila]